MNTRFLKTTLTVIGAIGFSTLGIFASDVLNGIDHNFPNIAGIGGAQICKTGSVPLRNGESLMCVDIYEASAGSKCPNKSPVNVLESEKNVNTPECYVASTEGAIPWTFISLSQAQRACASSGKRLPTSDEWYRMALGTEPEKCVTKKDSPEYTVSSECLSTVGTYNAIGNVWEWVDETINGNQFNERALPKEGYVASVDAGGVAITSSDDSQELYGEDYFWSKEDGVFGMIRGGYYGSESDAGLYTINASVQTSFASQGVGFRCVEDVF